MFDNPISTVMLDVMTCFLAGVLLIAVFNPNKSMPAPDLGPVIKLFIYKDKQKENSFYTVMYKKRMTPWEIVSKIKKAKAQGIKVVQIKVGVDKKTPFEYLYKLKNPILKLISYKKDHEFVVVWSTLPLSDEPRKIRRNRK